MKMSVKPKEIIPPSIVIKDSPDRGRGVFATVDFNKGDLIEQAPVLFLNKVECAIMEDTQLRFYAFEAYEKGGVVLALGYAGLLNHKTKPNCDFYSSSNSVIIVARRSIKTGEELFINYGWTKKMTKGFV